MTETMPLPPGMGGPGPDFVPQAAPAVVEAPAPEYTEAEYNGVPCRYRVVEDKAGETVVTAEGNVWAPKGSRVVLGLVRAPRGYGSEYIPTVVHEKDTRLVDKSASDETPNE